MLPGGERLVGLLPGGQHLAVDAMNRYSPAAAREGGERFAILDLGFSISGAFCRARTRQSKIGNPKSDLVLDRRPAKAHDNATVNTEESRSLKRIGHLAGACYLTVAIAAFVGFYHAPLVLPDASAVARHLTAMTELRFRLAVIADVFAVIVSIPMALLFYDLFQSIQRRQAALLALLLLVSAPVTFVGLLNYVAARLLLHGAPVVAALGATEREALGMLFVDLHTWGVMAEEVFWGIWLLPFGYLVIRSGFVPRLLGGLLVIGGVAYLAHSLITLLMGCERFPLLERATMLARGLAELPVMLWLVFKGAAARKDELTAA